MMVLTVILAIAALWLGGVALAEHVYDKGMRNQSLPGFITAIGLLGLWLSVSK
jgi:hypothetical protein